ncbi:MAG TPA: PilN domain-containing protein [Burkholderiaceae bacterium]|nr:PilN domain-containing protein [Burkholderiaceae bacterium]
MTTIAINLLPHRALKRAQRRRDFLTLVVIVLGGSALLVMLIGGIISGYIQAQEARNEFIRQENAALDKQIAEVAKLKEEIEALRQRKAAVEDLQADRNQPVHLLDELVKQTPEGTYLRSIKQDGKKVVITGIAQSNERVSELLRNLSNNSEWLEKPNLIEIKASDKPMQRGTRLYEFSLDVLIKRPAENKEAVAGAQPSATAAPNGAAQPVSPPAAAPAATK